MVEASTQPQAIMSDHATVSARFGDQPVGQPVGPGTDRTRPKADDHVSGTGLFAHEAFEVTFIQYGPRVTVAVADQTFDQIVAAGTLNRVFARSKDLGNGDHIGVVEAGAEIVEQVGEARITVRLVDGDDAPSVA